MDDLELELKRHERRRRRFIAEGCTEEEAWELAETLFDRDRDPMDDRRLCFECKNYVDDKKVCQKMTDRYGRPQRPLRFVLQRCPDFKLKETK